MGSARKRDGLPDENIKKEHEHHDDMHPLLEIATSEGKDGNMNNIFCFAALIDKETGTVYTNATGALPLMLLEGEQYYCLAYEYNNNYIHVHPVTDLKDEIILGGICEFSNRWRN